MELDKALDWAQQRRTAVLITIRSDGRAQSSDISYCVSEGSFVVSVTESRAKKKNMRRDPRIVLHITDPDSWSYLSFDGVAELTPAVAATNDAVADQLVAYYEAVAGKPHPDWDEYRQAMLDEKRLLVTLKPASVVGQINS